MNKPVKVTVTTMDGMVLDQFVLRHWRDDLDDEDEDTENYGSTASNSLLAQRLERDAKQQ